MRADRGACTDVVIRALRYAGFDLQRLIHEDMRRHFSEYPQRYGAAGPDATDAEAVVAAIVQDIPVPR